MQKLDGSCFFSILINCNLRLLLRNSALCIFFFSELLWIYQKKKFRYISTKYICNKRIYTLIFDQRSSKRSTYTIEVCKRENLPTAFPRSRFVLAVFTSQYKKIPPLLISVYDNSTLIANTANPLRWKFIFRFWTRFSRFGLSVARIARYSYW